MCYLGVSVTTVVGCAKTETLGINNVRKVLSDTTEGICVHSIIYFESFHALSFLSEIN